MVHSPNSIDEDYLVFCKQDDIDPNMYLDNDGDGTGGDDGDLKHSKASYDLAKELVDAETEPLITLDHRPRGLQSILSDPKARKFHQRMFGFVKPKATVCLQPRIIPSRNFYFDYFSDEEDGGVDDNIDGGELADDECVDNHGNSRTEELPISRSTTGNCLPALNGRERWIREPGSSRVYKVRFPASVNETRSPSLPVRERIITTRQRTYMAEMTIKEGSDLEDEMELAIENAKKRNERKQLKRRIKKNENCAKEKSISSINDDENNQHQVEIIDANNNDPCSMDNGKANFLFIPKRESMIKGKGNSEGRTSKWKLFSRVRKFFTKHDSSSKSDETNKPTSQRYEKLPRIMSLLETSL
ncbi:hypothetical protein RDWZM_010198 [Blomia tropicalis]|uniref:Uncharacterized protein n=1 Tax=Blomia tropicalis TaxID=40697 RepID=A0A9Q0LYZ1_BLOTA|nr:hypothetical protein RDWZM_010198 [Blomia tropicalis]